MFLYCLLFRAKKGPKKSKDEIAKVSLPTSYSLPLPALPSRFIPRTFDCKIGSEKDFN